MNNTNLRDSGGKLIADNELDVRSEIEQILRKYRMNNLEVLMGQK